MRPIHAFTISPSLPPELEHLRELAYNLRWTWDRDTIDLFRRLDRDLWEETYHNPVLMLGTIKQERLEEAAEDDGFLAHLERVYQGFKRYIKGSKTWYQRQHGKSEGPLVAYFCAEFGLTECLPIYSGGLGILAGDHLKSASDLGLPLVGVGLLYQQGYFVQYLNADGWQQERYPINDFYNLPLRLVYHDNGEPVTTRVEYPGRDVLARVWQAQVGRIPLYLLDTNIPENAPADRDITDQLYGGDQEMRIRQEIMLGIGGLRALDALGLRPTVCHLNEGHSAFLALERIRQLMEEHNLPFAAAREVAMAGNVFTSHTPVPAGIDRFPPALIDRYFQHLYPRLGLTRAEFLALGQDNPDDPNDLFSMAALALRLSAASNGVSVLHGQVTRQLFQHIWPGLPAEEVPIRAVTNGVHTRSWISRDMAILYDRYLGPRWAEDPGNPRVWQRVDEIPDEELWRTHERRRERLVAFARRRVREQVHSRGGSPLEIERASEILHPEALTIGFGRRFATYKRATLILHDLERLHRILVNPQQPVQIIYAGKAHPHDNEGKELIRQIVHLLNQEGFRNHIVFLENYDMNVARYLVQGVDVWLNTPLRLREASGTSGMKAAMNGVVNLSVLDGWWDEAYQPEIGWAIGQREVYENQAYQDEVESHAIYNLLEEELVPLFYRRGADGLPRGWIARMKASIRAVGPAFNTNRMVYEYARDFYMPAAQRHAYLTENNMARARMLAQWKSRLRQLWPQIRIESVQFDPTAPLCVGTELGVQATIYLGMLEPADVAVELVHGPVNPAGEIIAGVILPLACVDTIGDGAYLFAGAIPCRTSGRYGYALRVLPQHVDLHDPFEPRLIKWSNGV